MEVEDLRAEIEHGSSIEEAAQFLCRSDSIDPPASNVRIDTGVANS
jgi:hypothetical protein